MGIINEQIKCKNHNIEISVDQRGKEETRKPWKIASVDFDWEGRFTPKELLEIGEWFIATGKRLGKEYTSSGALKKMVVSS